MPVWFGAARRRQVFMRQAFIVAGIVFGDESKGATVDWITRKYRAQVVVRYNGGPQAAHNVVTPDGRHHTFAQFGSGTFQPGVRTHLSRHVLINPMSMMREEAHLREVGVTDAFERLTVDEGCVVITPFQRALNRLTEWSRGIKAHGSCGQGVGQARSDQLQCGDLVLYASDLRDAKAAREKLKFVQRRMQTFAMELATGPAPKGFQFGAQPEFSMIFDDNAVDWCLGEYGKVPMKVVPGDYLKLLVERNDRIVLEGAQGILLDETHGTVPHNTWTDTTCRNANTLLSEVAFDGNVRRVGVVRTYFTRHGAGPFETEDWRISAVLPESHNNGDGFQGSFRVGHFDAVAARHALRVSGGISEIALTHVDAIDRLKFAKIRNSEKHDYEACSSVPEFVQQGRASSQAASDAAFERADGGAPHRAARHRLGGRMTTPRQTLPAMPPRIKSLPMDERRFPIPWFVQWFEDGVPGTWGVGKPDFRVVDSRKREIATVQKRCWICGGILGWHMGFVIGPMCAINRVSSSRRRIATARCSPRLPARSSLCRRCTGARTTSPPASWSRRRLARPQPRRRDGLAHLVLQAGNRQRRQRGAVPLWRPERDTVLLRGPQGDAHGGHAQHRHRPSGAPGGGAGGGHGEGTRGLLPRGEDAGSGALPMNPVSPVVPGAENVEALENPGQG